MTRLFSILIIVFFFFEIPLYAECTFMNAAPKRQVPLKGLSSHSKGDFEMRSPLLYPVQAFIDDNNLLLAFSELPCTTEVSVVNVQTNEVHYSETCVATGNVVISLHGLKSGEYRLEISLNADTTILYGDFIF